MDDTEDRTEVVPEYGYLIEIPNMGMVGDHGLELPASLSVEKWTEYGLALGKAEARLAWLIGDWYNYGLTYYKTVARKIIEAPGWKGPSYGTCRNYASVCKMFPVSRRRDILPFSQHSELRAAPIEEQDKLLDGAVAYTVQNGKPPPMRLLREQVKETKRSSRTAEGVRRAEIRRAKGLYSVGFCDPPWSKIDVFREMGREPPLAEDAVLFVLAATDVEAAGTLLSGWKFDNVGSIVWILPRRRYTGWIQEEHRLLLIGARGDIKPSYAPPSTMEGSSVMALIKVINAMFPDYSQKVQCLGQPIEGFDDWRPNIA